MEIHFPHQIVYETAEPVPLSDVIDSLDAIEQIMVALGPLMEGCVPGLTVEKIGVSLKEASQQSPLRETVLATIVVTFQPDLVKEVPTFFQELTGIHIPDHYNTLVTLLFCALLFYGIDFVYKQIGKLIGGEPTIKRQFDGLVAEVANSCGKTVPEIMALLDSRYGKTRGRNIADAAIKFFAPSRRQANVPVSIGPRHYDSPTVAAIPTELDIAEADTAKSSEQMEGVEIELHAQDIDRPKQGWAAVIPSVSKDRLRMELYPPITPEQIYTRSRIKGDVVVIYEKQRSGDMKPRLFHLVRLRDD